jgi:hypothetical protein
MKRRGTIGKAGMAAALLGMALAVGCSSTEMKDTWTDPSAQGARLSRVVVIAMTPDEGVRRLAEDEFVRQIKGAQVVPSYQALQGVDLRDKQAVVTQLRARGFDGALVMRLAGVSEQVRPVAFDDYYDYAYRAEFGPEVETQTIVRVESKLYALDQGKLIWSGTSKTFDPSSAKDVVDDVSRAVAKALEKKGLIA